MWGEQGLLGAAGNLYLTGSGSVGLCVCTNSSFVVCPFPRVCYTSISENCQEAFNLDKRKSVNGRGGRTQTRV